MRKEKSAVQQGWDAFLDDIPITDNPYKRGESARTRWNGGWKEAEDRNNEKKFRS